MKASSAIRLRSDRRKSLPMHPSDFGSAAEVNGNLPAGIKA